VKACKAGLAQADARSRKSMALIIPKEYAPCNRVASLSGGVD
jgi:hypothetical protein